MLNRNIASIFNFSEVNFGYKKDEYDIFLNKHNNNSIYEGDIENLKEINSKNHLIVNIYNNSLIFDLEFKKIQRFQVFYLVIKIHHIVI